MHGSTCWLRPFVLFATLTAALLDAEHARALIPSPVGGRPGEIDVSFRLSLERGKVEPSSNEASFQKAQWELYTLGVGYTHGRIGPLLDVTFRLEGTYVRSPAERSDPNRGSVAPDDCLSGVIPGPGRCQFHPDDDGGYISPSITFNVLHPGDFSLGFFVPWKIGVKLGPYFDGDLIGDRTDPNYDAAYTAGYPERSDRIRMMRFGFALLPYVQVTQHAALELGYVQKIFGYDTPATQFYTVGARAAF